MTAGYGFCVRTLPLSPRYLIFGGTNPYTCNSCENGWCSIRDNSQTICVGKSWTGSPPTDVPTSFLTPEESIPPTFAPIVGGPRLNGDVCDECFVGQTTDTLKVENCNYCASLLCGKVIKSNGNYNQVCRPDTWEPL